MQPSIFESLSGIYSFLGYFVSSVALVFVFCFVYLQVTPFAELRLVREGKKAPAVSLGGAVLGFVLPVASAISQSVSYLDMVIWGIVALIVQVAVFVMLRVSLGGLVRDIAEDKMGPAIVVAVFSISAGILNAACLTW